jgi:hypothetical protein
MVEANVERYRQIERRLSATEVVAASLLSAAERPDDLFAAMFYDLRQKAKELKEKWSQQAKVKLENTLTSDMKSKGVPIVSLQISLGQYRGSKFVTSAKMTARLKTKTDAQNLLTYLQSKYSPKFKLKSFNSESGEASYNVR